MSHIRQMLPVTTVKSNKYTTQNIAKGDLFFLLLQEPVVDVAVVTSFRHADLS